MGEQISSLREGMKKSPVKISIGEAGEPQRCIVTLRKVREKNCLQGFPNLSNVLFLQNRMKI